MTKKNTNPRHVSDPQENRSSYLEGGEVWRYTNQAKRVCEWREHGMGPLYSAAQLLSKHEGVDDGEGQYTSINCQPFLEGGAEGR